MNTIKIKCAYCGTFITVSQTKIMVGVKCAACRQWVNPVDVMEEINPRVKAFMTHANFIQQQLPIMLYNMIKIYLSISYLANEKAKKHGRLQRIFQSLVFRFQLLCDRFKSDEILQVEKFQSSLVTANYRIVSQILRKLAPEPGALEELKKEWEENVKYKEV